MERPRGFGWPAVGIDLGTTNSCIGTFRNDHIEIIRNEHGDHTTASCVAFTDNGRLIGSDAKSRVATNHAGTVFDIKRLIGRKYSDPVVIAESRRLPFRIVEKLGRAAVEVDFKGETRTFTPEEISSMILGKLKAMAEHHLGLTPGSDIACVVTVPSTFNIYQRQSTISACAIAGLQVFRTVPEPTAAAFAYDHFRVSNPDEKPERLVLVFDVGGGTLGATLLTLEDGIAEVVNTAGDDHLGGEDFDHRLVNFLARDFDRKNKTRIFSDLRALSRLRLAAERAKRVLSSTLTTSVEIESLHTGIDYRRNVSRWEFEECCKDLFRHITEVLDNLLGKFDRSLIDDILLVGGSTRIPKIQATVSQYFGGRELNKSINPDEAAAYGASLLAATLSGDKTSIATNKMLLLDVISLPINVFGRSRSSPIPLLHKNTTIPVKSSIYLSTEVENQEKVNFAIYEGKKLDANYLLCEIELLDIAPAPAPAQRGPNPVPQFQLTIDIDSNYIIDFTLEERSTGRKVNKRIDRSISSLSEKDIKTMNADERAMRQADEIDAERAVFKNELESEVYLIEDKLSNLKLNGRISSYHEEVVKSSIEETLQWLKDHPRAPPHEYRIFSKSLFATYQRAAENGRIDTPPSQAENATASQNTSQHRDPATGASDQPTGPSTSQVAREKSEHASQTVVEEVTQIPFKGVENGRWQGSESSHGYVAGEVDDSTPQRSNILLSPEPSSSSSSMTESVPLSRPRTTTPLSIEGRLRAFFLETAPRDKYTDQDLQDISMLLRNMGHKSWSSVPRIYTVLRRIDELQLIDTFIELGITDFWFPFSQTSLPDKLPPSVRSRFVDAQSAIFTIALELEKGEERRHATFGPGETLPFEVVGYLGKGGYGSVEKVVSLLSHKEYARKNFRRKKIFSRQRDDIKGFKNELSILKRVDHTHCVELICSYTDPKYLALIMSPVADCNLAKYYEHAASSQDKLSLLRGFYGCLANALQYLHSSKIRHRDIKPENILIKGSRVLLTDFGLSFDWEHLSRSTTTADSAKTPVYAAPEVAFFERRKNSSSDIWSLGCVFLEMMTVLKGDTVSAIREYFKQTNDNYRYYDNLNAARRWTKRIVELGIEEDSIPVDWIAEMLDKDPSKRPTASTLFIEIADTDAAVSFCGTCCHSADDTDDTDDGFDDHHLWAETMEQTVRAA